jgi:putative hydrolase of HD superfamily
MKDLTDFLFQAHHLKRIQRTGYAFLGPGEESVAEHSFSATMIGFILSRLNPEVNALRLITMCLTHDLAEARTGDLNYVQKKYVDSNESQAIADTTKHLPFGNELAEIISEFNAGRTTEAKLAHDADQLAMMLELKVLEEMGFTPPTRWLKSVSERLITSHGQRLAQEIQQTPWDRWWTSLFR